MENIFLIILLYFPVLHSPLWPTGVVCTSDYSMFTRALKNAFLTLAYVDVSTRVLDKEHVTFVLNNFISSDQDMLFYCLRLECILVTVTHLSCILWCNLITSHFFFLSCSAFHLSVTAMTPVSATVIPGLCISARCWQFLRVILCFWGTIFNLAGCFWREEPFVIMSKPAAISHFWCRRWQKRFIWIMFRKYEAKRRWHCILLSLQGVQSTDSFFMYWW